MKYFQWRWDLCLSEASIFMCFLQYNNTFLERRAILIWQYLYKTLDRTHLPKSVFWTKGSILYEFSKFRTFKSYLIWHNFKNCKMLWFLSRGSNFIILSYCSSKTELLWLGVDTALPRHAVQLSDSLSAEILVDLDNLLFILQSRRSLC